MLGQGSQAYTNVDTGSGNSIVYTSHSQDIGSNLLASGSFAAGLAVAKSLPTPAAKLVG